MGSEFVVGVNPHTGEPIKIAVLTSGGDAQGMNAAVRAVVRTALSAGAQPFACMEGWIGAVKGGDYIKPMGWSDVSSILNRGGTVIGSARSEEFRTLEGRRKAAENLVNLGIDHLIVIGGDGSLSGAALFRSEWAEHMQALVKEGRISAEVAASHPQLFLVGLVGSIDNDLVGTDMTIGADSALQRIVTAIDQISATAASHQRTFIIEVMGRHCGYLPLMAGVAGGADYVFTPERPAEPGWEEDLCEKLRLGRLAGRRESIVLVAEGAEDTQGRMVTTTDVAEAIDKRLGENPHVSILGHIQRGGAPSAYDRWMSTLLGYAAVQEVLAQDASEASILGVRHNRVAKINLEQAVAATRAIQGLISDGDYEQARKARGQSFYDMDKIYQVLSAPPQEYPEQKRSVRVGILHAGGLAPGMNAATRAAVRMGLHRGWTMLGIDGSWEGLEEGNVKELTWADVEGWAFDGGAELGTRREIPPIESYYALGRSIERNEIDALVVIGGFNAYVAVQAMMNEQSRFPALRLPIILVPASIDNNLPGAELAIGADTALNNAVWALDRIKESAAASRRCFVAESMGRRCGYLALMSGIASGAEYVYLNEEPLTLERLGQDAKTLRQSFEQGRRLLLVVMNEETSTHYDRSFVAQAFEAAGEGLFDVRNAALGYVQQGGQPTAFDRLLATRLVDTALQTLEDLFERGEAASMYVGTRESEIVAQSISQMEGEVDMVNRRPLEQWWLALTPVTEVVSLENAEVPVGKVPVRTEK